MSRFHVTPLISHVLSAPGVDSSSLSVDSILCCLQILVPYYVDDVVNDGCYDQLVQLVECLLRESLSPISYWSSDSYPTQSYPDSSNSPIGSSTSAWAERDHDPGLLEFPPIRHRELELRVFTPRSSHGHAMTPDGHLDNRRLEWLGDSVIQLSVTLLLEELYPHLRTTMVHFIRCRVISNNNLGAISRKYRLYKRYREVSGIEIRDLPSSKVHADLLEAYIGAVYKEMQFSELHPFLVALFKPSVTAACHVHQQLPHEPRLKITTWDDETGTYRPESASPRDWRSVALPVENTYERFLATCRSLGFSPRFEYEEERDGRGSLSVRVTIYDDAKYIATGFGVTSYQARAEASEIAIRRVIQLANANDGYSSRDNGLPAGPSRASTNANANPAPNDAGSFRKRRRSSILLSTHD